MVKVNIHLCPVHEIHEKTAALIFLVGIKSTNVLKSVFYWLYNFDIINITGDPFDSFCGY